MSDDKFELMLSKLEGSDYLENASDGGGGTPLLSLVQPMSELAQAGEAKPGQVVFLPTGVVLCEAGASFPVIPLYYWSGRTLFPPRDQGSNIICSSPDGVIGMGLPGGKCVSCPKAVWQNSTPPDCMNSHNFAVYMPEAPEEERLGIAKFARSSHKCGGAFLTRLNGLRATPPFANAFRLGSKLEEKNGNKYWVFSMEAWEDTGRLEKQLDKYTDQFESLFGTCKELADKVKADHNDLVAAISGAGTPQLGVGDNEVPF